MTAEVAIMNKEAIALAADSAVTFQEETGQKIFTSASKIFTLSKYQPVGVMIYGNASFMGVPWETIIKVYRNDLEQKTFKTIGEYAQNFLSFVAENKLLFSEDTQNQYVESSIYSYFEFITNEIDESFEKVIKGKGKIDDASIKEITSQIIKVHFEKWQKSELIPSVPENFIGDLRQKYKSTINAAKKKVFEQLPLTSHSSRQLTEIAVNLFVKFRSGLVTSSTSGLVIAGFGTEDIFPMLESFLIECKIDNYLKHKKNKEECADISFQTSAAIRPFAQSEMVTTFMTGADPNYHNAIYRDMEQICISYPQVLVDDIDCLDKEQKEDLKNRLKKIGQKEFNKYSKKLSDYRKEHYIKPIMEVVQGLPKDELAAMAETLINLTSFKRRVSMEEETVGGPIDVAVISKGDGFVWIKRKHYFEPELNQQFFANYYKEVDTNGTKTTERSA